MRLKLNRKLTKILKANFKTYPLIKRAQVEKLLLDVDRKKLSIENEL